MNSKSRSEGSYGVEGSAADLKQQASQLGEDFRNLAASAGQTAKEVATQQYERGLQTAYAAEETVEAYIRERPIKAVLMALGIGACLGALWRRG